LRHGGQRYQRSRGQSDFQIHESSSIKAGRFRDAVEEILRLNKQALHKRNSMPLMARARVRVIRDSGHFIRGFL
jgi:hypothetical protein